MDEVARKRLAAWRISTLHICQADQKAKVSLQDKLVFVNIPNVFAEREILLCVSG
jgi:hypothetical protein